MSAHVYVIGAGDGSGLVKIGVARNPHRRLTQIQRMSPVKLELLAIVPGVGAEGEQELHERFHEARRWGEWFERTPEVMWLIGRFPVHGEATAPDWRTFWLRESERHSLESRKHHAIAERAWSQAKALGAGAES